MRMNSENVKSQFSGVLRHIRLCGKAKGIFAAVDSSGREFSDRCWEEVVSSQLPQLVANPEKVLKSDGDSKVVMGRLELGGFEKTVVVKVYGSDKGILGLIRENFRCKASRNYKASVRLLEGGIRAAFPLAAIQGGSGDWMQAGVFVTEYVDGAVDLHDFLRDNVSLDGKDADLRLKKGLAEQIGRIFAMLDGGGFWHRDSKAGNFLVCRRGETELEILLVDLDGIKRKLTNSRKAGFRGLAKLASTLIWHGGINRSDYLRAFSVYCNLTGLDKSRRKEVFRRLAQRAVALRLLTLAKAAIDQGKRKTEGSRQ